MKNARKRIFLMFLAIVMILCTGLGSASFAVGYDFQNENLYYYSDWIKAEGNYGFPENIRHAKGHLIGTTDEVIVKSQIPDKILKTMSTEDLIVLIMEYPRLPVIHAYQTVAEGYEIIKSEFNGIGELLTRTDAFSKLIETYNNYEIPDEKIMDWDSLCPDNFIDELNRIIRDEEYVPLVLADGAVYTSINVLEMLIYDIINTRNSSMNVNIFTESYIDKIGEKIDSAYFDDVNPVELLTYIVNEDDYTALEVNIISELSKASGNVGTQMITPFSSIPAVYNANYIIKTPNGSNATVTIDPNISNQTPSQYASLVAGHASASVVSSASRTFNCHSFAWLQRQYPGSASTTNMNYQNMWLNSFSAFANDKFYTKTSTATSGKIAAWTAHSGIISQTNVTYHSADMDTVRVIK